MYDDRRMYQWDNENALEYAREEGIEKGEMKKAFAVAAKLKNFGYPVPEIAEATDLTEEEINNL